MDEAEYPALPSQGQDPASQDSVAAAEAAPLAAALMEISPPAFTEGQDESGAPSSEREEGEQVVDRDGFLVERAAGPHIVKEIIIYDVYDNDENVGAGNPVEPTSTGEIDHPETNVVDVSHDSDNCPVVAPNQNVHSVEIANNVVDAAVGGANKIVENVDQNKENVESNNSTINLESSVDPAKNGAPLIEEIINVVDEIVDQNSELNEMLLRQQWKGWRRRSPRSSPRPQTLLRTFNPATRVVLCLRNLKMWPQRWPIEGFALVAFFPSLVLSFAVFSHWWFSILLFYS